MRRGSLLLVVQFIVINIFSQTFYFGNDLSYANMMEDCGATFKEKGIEKDVYQIFTDHGTNLVRIRLWHNPSWQNSISQPVGVKDQYNDYQDAKEAIQRAKAVGMQVLLGFHFSDFWADPGRQVVPAAWSPIAGNLETLKDSVYNYVYNILSDLENNGLMPEIVKVGNETNSGIMRYFSMDEDFKQTGLISDSWSRHAQLYNAAIQAVRDVSASTVIKPKIALHFAGFSNLSWRYSNIISNGVTDFDIVGFSYYYAWHGNSISTLGNVVKSLKAAYPTKEIMAVETGYPWTTKNFDALPNIITDADPQYSPLSPEMQLKYMVDYTKAVKKNGGSGVIFWEPAWVSTKCRNAWGQGSSQEHAAFFEDDTYNFMENGGGLWTEPMFYENENNVIVTFKVDMTGKDASKGVFITGTFTGESWKILPMYYAGNNIYSYTAAMMPGDSGAYYYLNDSSWQARETIPSECALMWGTDRRYKVENTHTSFDDRWGRCSMIIPDQVKVTFQVDMTGLDVSEGVYVTGDMNAWTLATMTHIGNNIYNISYDLKPDYRSAYYFKNATNWIPGSRETVPSECAKSAIIMNDPSWTTDRAFIVPPFDTIMANKYGSCDTITTAINKINEQSDFIDVYPVPSKGLLALFFEDHVKYNKLEVISISGNTIKKQDIDNYDKVYNLDLSDIERGIYFLKLIDKDRPVVLKKIILN